MDPSVIASIGAALAIIGPALGAGYGIANCGPALAAVTSEKPELGSKLLITIVMAEALAIYGLLISFMIISQLPLITTEAAGFRSLLAGASVAGAAAAASVAISYSGPALMTAAVEKPESYSTNILSVVMSEALAIYGLLIAFMLIV